MKAKLVKVCGLKTQSQIDKVDKLGADMIGLNFYPKSKRYIESDLDLGLDHMNSIKVGVFVNEDMDSLRSMAIKYKIDLLQLHGDEDISYLSQLSSEYSIIKAFGVDQSFDFDSLEPFADHCKYFLFDTKTTDYGGSGRKFDWNKLYEYTGKTPFLLSGGINPYDVSELKNINHKTFAGVDINSRFESSAGIKDLALVSSFINEYKK